MLNLINREQSMCLFITIFHNILHVNQRRNRLDLFKRDLHYPSCFQYRAKSQMAYLRNIIFDLYHEHKIRVLSGSDKKYLLKKIVILTFTFSSFIISLSGQQYDKVTNPSYRFASSPGFVNISEISGAIGLSDSMATNSKYYYGATNVFGYQISRNFFGGVGVGFFFYDTRQLIPLYLEYKYSIYLKGVTPYFYADGGILQDPVDFFVESKIFLNPGIGISRYISSRLEGNLSLGLMLQTRTSLMRVSFINFRLGIIFRKNPYRMFKL